MEENKTLLSVIIPMYNCASVIERCLNSIDYEDAEIIVVNDGSTDDSLTVVQNYILRMKELGDERFKVINKQNGGVSSARNLGIKEANGKYIVFVDADDYLLQGGLQYVVALAEEYDADVVKFDERSVLDNKFLEQYDTAETSNVTIIKASGKDVLLRYDIADWVVWDGVYRRKVIVDNNIQFRTDLKLHEDDVFNGMVYCHAKIVLAVNVAMYCYVHASSCSWTHQRSPERLRLLIESGYKAARYRREYVLAHFPEAMQMERFKYMRWVKNPKEAIAAQLTLDEYIDVLNEYQKLGVYPLQYKWISTIFFYAPMKYKLKCAIKTWFTNHPRLAYMIMSLKKLGITKNS